MKGLYKMVITDEQSKQVAEFLDLLYSKGYTGLIRCDTTGASSMYMPLQDALLDLANSKLSGDLHYVTLSMRTNPEKQSKHVRCSIKLIHDDKSGIKVSEANIISLNSNWEIITTKPLTIEHNKDIPSKVRVNSILKARRNKKQPKRRGGP